MYKPQTEITITLAVNGLVMLPPEETRYKFVESKLGDGWNQIDPLLVIWIIAVNGVTDNPCVVVKSPGAVADIGTIVIADEIIKELITPRLAVCVVVF